MRFEPLLAPLLAAVLFTACGERNINHPAYHSPLLRSRWTPLVPREAPPHTDDQQRTEKQHQPQPVASEPAPDLRAAMVARAQALLNDSTARAEYGTADLEAILAEVVPGLPWRAAQGLEAFVRTAKHNGAHTTDGDPEPGDIVLFHNQVDANGNGDPDDWLTGCGIVTERDGPLLHAIIRTGNAPRAIVAWPDGPAVRKRRNRLVNSFLRVPHRSDPQNTAYLAGALYAGHVDIEKLAAAASK